MKITIIEKEKLRNLVLPEKISGSYWITDFDENGIEKNLISVEGHESGWQMMSNNDVLVLENNENRPIVDLKEYSFYTLRDEVRNKSLLIYTHPISHQTFLMYSPGGLSEITIGKNNACNVSYNILDELSAKIIFKDDKFTIVDNQSKFGIYVNNVKIENEQELSYGDVVFILGLKIIPFKYQNSCYLIINNPRRVVLFNNLLSQNIPFDNDMNFNEDEEIKEMEVYSSDDYFHKKPRFFSDITELKMNIDAPPAKQSDEQTPALLTIGPMLTMGMTSVMMGYVAISNLISKKVTIKESLPSLVMCVTMLASILVWPTIMRAYTKRKKKKDEKKRQIKYSEYIESKKKTISEELVTQKQILLNNYPSIQDCENIILNNQVSLWQRRITDDDFLTVNLGYGDYPMKIDIHYPEEHFSLEEDNLKSIVNSLGSEPKILQDAPFAFSFFKNNISAIVGSDNYTSEYVKNLLLQIITFSSYDDLKIAVLTNDVKVYNWEFCKVLPHCFSNDKQVRYLASNNDEYKEVCYRLENILSSRIEGAGTSTPNVKDYKTIYLVITDCIKSVRNYDLIKKILESKQNYGFSLLILNEKISNLPDQCNSFINIDADKVEYITSSSSESQKLKNNNCEHIDMYKYASKLMNIPIEFTDNMDSQIPEIVSFLEMYDVGEVEQLNVINRWHRNNPMMSLGVPVGIGANGEKISIDLHEKYHGPHGLIAGMTGSGKSEFIITYILSMAINYHPYEVQFILIDYKGGGLAGAFENQVTGMKLPHLVGTITNLDVNEIKRSLSSIDSELKRRQKLFNKAREISGESTIDIYKYQKMYRDGLIDEPVSHLFIISDEFAELKKEQPEFMTELISTARIGRSLGVHLILATQKPSGVVDPQIWSNTRFRVCLRVQEKSDSTEVIKSPEAAYLRNTGRFYFQVGYNEIFILGQSAWAGGKYFPSKKIRKNIDLSIDFINNIGYKYKSTDTKKKQIVEAQGEELPNILSYLYRSANEENIKVNPLWLPKIPEYINIIDLMNKYNFVKNQNDLEIIIGEYDIPNHQEQNLLKLSFIDDGNILVYGSSGSGKENLLISAIYSSMLIYNPNEINYYILDFGSESLKMFNDSPIVGNILTVDSKEEIANLYRMLDKEIEKRKDLLSEYNGDYKTYISSRDNSLPAIVIAINNYEAYAENYPEYDDKMNTLTRECNKYGIYFIMTAVTPNGVRFKLRQNFAKIFTLQQNAIDDYTTIMGNVNKTYPSKLFGRGIIRFDDIYEFQTALVAQKEEITSFIKNQCASLCQKYSDRAKKIPVIPKIVSYDDIKESFSNDNEMIVGIDKDTLDVIKYDFVKNYITVATSNDLSNISNFVNPLINQSIFLNKNNLIVINAMDIDIDNNFTKYYKYVNKDFNNIFEAMEKFISTCESKYIQNNYDKSILANEKGNLCIILGLDDFKSKLSSENKAKFNDIFTKAKELGVFSYIIIESTDKMKKYLLDDWYKNCVNNVNGFWFGNGIDTQIVLKTNIKTKEMKENIEDPFVFVIKQGKPELVKYVEEFNLKAN